VQDLQYSYLFFLQQQTISRRGSSRKRAHSIAKGFIQYSQRTWGVATIQSDQD
jgi:hypothetical protein